MGPTTQRQHSRGRPRRQEATQAALTLNKLRRRQEEDERWAALGLTPVHTGKRYWDKTRKTTRSVRGKMVADFPDLVREWDWWLNHGTDPATTRGSSRSRVFGRCHLDPDQVWDPASLTAPGGRNAVPTAWASAAILRSHLPPNGPRWPPSGT